jgi:hypothetical protein
LKDGQRAALVALLPGGAHPLLANGVLDTDFEQFLDSFAAVAPAQFWRGFRLGLWAAVWVSPLLVRRLPPLTRLEPTERERALGAMAESSLPELRQLMSVVKTVVAFHYGALPEVRTAVAHP